MRPCTPFDIGNTIDLAEDKGVTTDRPIYGPGPHLVGGVRYGGPYRNQREEAIEMLIRLSNVRADALFSPR